jgi:hypothetical protein
MALYSQLDASTKEVINAHINRRWGQLYELQKEWGEKALKYLFFTNSGGAIATLSFLGASKELNGIGAKVALFLFILGLVLTGISTATTFHHMSGLFKQYKESVEDLYGDKITWFALAEADKKRAVATWLDYAIPYSSFICFIAGSVVGASALFA